MAEDKIENSSKPEAVSPNDEKAETKAKKSNSSTKSSSSVPSKRKAKGPSSPSKAPRRSARSAPKTPRSPLQILQFLLSPSSLPLTRPKDETSALSESDSKIRTYSESEFTPFEELMCAVILSRPISHALGVRSIRTLLNPPYAFSTPEKLKEAGFEGVRKALDEARTQHRQKTAEELVGLGEAVTGVIGEGDKDWEKVVREKLKEDVDRGRELLSKNIKGIGKTGLDIFFRRIQSAWSELYPFVDGRTAGSLEKIGLPSDADELRDLLQENWKDINSDDVLGKDGDEKQRRAFVIILERAVGADLEGNVDDVKNEAEKS